MPLFDPPFCLSLFSFFLGTLGSGPRRVDWHTIRRPDLRRVSLLLNKSVPASSFCDHVRTSCECRQKEAPWKVYLISGIHALFHGLHAFSPEDTGMPSTILAGVREQLPLLTIVMMMIFTCQHLAPLKTATTSSSGHSVGLVIHIHKLYHDKSLWTIVSS